MTSSTLTSLYYIRPKVRLRDSEMFLVLQIGGKMLEVLLNYKTDKLTGIDVSNYKYKLETQYNHRINFKSFPIIK